MSSLMSLSVSPDTAAVTGTLNGLPIADTALVELRHEPGDATTTTIDADSTSIEINEAWTMIRVTVRDAAGNRVYASAGTVTLSTTRGRLGVVTDHGDGTYTARLESGEAPGTAIVSGTLDGEVIDDVAEVVFRPLVQGADPPPPASAPGAED
jgi:hypothetical protein